MVRKALVILLAVIDFGLVAWRVPVRADAPEEVYFEIMATPAPEPVAMPWHVERHEWSAAEIDGLASVYWMVNTDAEKKAVTCVIWNRARHGAPFASDLVGVIHQRGEFQRGKVSDRNRKKAQEYLDQCAAGIFGVPRSAVYISRRGGTMELYDDQWRLVLTVG